MAKKQDPKFGAKIITGEGRASFAHLDKPDDSQYGQNKYKLDVIFHDPAAIAGLKEKCNELAMLNFKTLEKIQMPWKDGNANAKYKGYEGGEYFTAKCKQQPITVDGNRKALDPKEIYSG